MEFGLIGYLRGTSLIIITFLPVATTIILGLYDYCLTLNLFIYLRYLNKIG